ncbi:MAG: CBS domain-containing protein, partial [Anaerolineae bacterium]|nr:CBS domain-containing protein [Anaerolineae bacterium]
MSVRQAAQVMSQYNLEVLPAVDEHGCCLGVVTRSDVASALSRSIR